MKREYILDYNPLSDTKSWKHTPTIYTGKRYPPRIPSDISPNDILVFVAYKFYGYFPRKPFYLNLEFGSRGILFDDDKKLLNDTPDCATAEDYLIASITCNNNYKKIKCYNSSFISEKVGCYRSWEEIRELKTKTDMKKLMLALLEPAYITQHRINQVLSEITARENRHSEVKEYDKKTKVVSDFIDKARSLTAIDRIDLYNNDPQNKLLDPQYQLFGYFTDEGNSPHSAKTNIGYDAFPFK